MPQTMNAALSALSPERSGSGSALISALRQVGATIGVAVLGSVLGSVYRAHLSRDRGARGPRGAPPRAAWSRACRSPTRWARPAYSSRRGTSFVQGLDTMLWVCGGIALASAILALIFLPRRPDGISGAPRAGAACAEPCR